MKLTRKDAEFLSLLKTLMETQDLLIEFRGDGTKRLILRKNYGARIEQHFGMTRQGVRWRFSRLMNEIYPQAYMTILFIESNFGTGLRRDAMAIARQQAELRGKTLRINKDSLIKKSSGVVNHGEHED